MIVSEPVGAYALRSASVLKRLAFLHRSFNLVYAQSRPVSPSGMRLVYLGEGESLPYIREMIAPDEVGLFSEKVSIARLEKMAREIPASGAWFCVELNRLLLPFLPKNGLLTFPWLRQRIYLNSIEYKKRRRKIEDNFGRKVRKYQYTFRLVRDEKSVAYFHERLYLPYVTARFGNSCYPRTLGELWKAVRRGFLLQVLRDNRWIAGVVCCLQKDEVSARAFGHLPEEEYSLRLGGLSAAYYGLLQHARQHSFSCVDLMRSRPNERDGIYCHKKRWGAVAEKDCWPHTAICLFPPKDTLVPNPLESLLIWDGREFREMGKAGNV